MQREAMARTREIIGTQWDCIREQKHFLRVDVAHGSRVCDKCHLLQVSTFFSAVDHDYAPDALLLRSKCCPAANFHLVSTKHPQWARGPMLCVRLRWSALQRSAATGGGAAATR